MATNRGRTIEFRDDTAINVVGLLKSSFGDNRTYPLALARFPLDESLAAEAVEGDVRLTRLRDAVMAKVRATGRVSLDCVRCLRQYDQPFTVEFSEEYRQSVDVRTGIALEQAEVEVEEASLIDENHELDLANVLRQEILLALPMRPDCGESCPGPEALLGSDQAEEPADDRFAALQSLLGDDGAAPRD